MIKFVVNIFLIFIFLISLDAQAYRMKPSKNRGTSSKSSRYISSEAGLNIPKVGVAIDAYYDSRLDTFAPGLKLLSVSVTNRSGKTIYFYPRKDQWKIIDHIGKSHKADNHLKYANKTLWEKLPDHIQLQLEYPRAVRDGNSVNFSVFFNDDIELNYFREIIWKSSDLKKEFYIKMFAEQNSEGSAKEIPIPETIKLNPPVTVDEIRRSQEKPENLERKSDPIVIPREFDPSLDDFSIPVDD